MLALLPLVSLAADVVVESSGAVDVRINGVPVAYDSRARRAQALGLDPGMYHVQLRDLSTHALLAEALVHARDAERLVWSGGKLDRLVSATQSAGGQGDLTIRGNADVHRVALDGRALTSSTRAWNATVPAGAHALKVSDATGVLFDGWIDVRKDLNTDCQLVYGRVAACEVAPRPVREVPPPTRVPPPDPHRTPPAPPPPGATGPVKVTFVRRDMMDMCNIYVDGRKIAEFRAGMESEASVDLGLGVHTIEIKDFTEFDLWTRGRLTVTAGDEIRLGFDDEDGIEVYNRTNAWAPN